MSNIDPNKTISLYGSDDNGDTPIITHFGGGGEPTDAEKPESSKLSTLTYRTGSTTKPISELYIDFVIPFIEEREAPVLVQAMRNIREYFDTKIFKLEQTLKLASTELVKENPLFENIKIKTKKLIKTKETWLAELRPILDRVITQDVEAVSVIEEEGKQKVSEPVVKPDVPLSEVNIDNWASDGWEQLKQQH